MKRKKNWILVGAVSITLLLSGCGTGGFEGKINIGDPVETPSPAPVETNAPVKTAEPLITKAPKASLPLGDSMEFAFSSGAGGWATILELEPDGTFQGEYHDSEMVISGEGYEATYYTCKFEGRFKNIEKVNAHTYKMTLAGYETEETPGKEWIEDDVLYIASGPYGIEEGTDFYFYLPSLPINEASEDMLSWWPLRFSPEGQNAETISMYAVYNINTGECFFAE